VGTSKVQIAEIDNTPRLHIKNYGMPSGNQDSRYVVVLSYNDFRQTCTKEQLRYWRIWIIRHTC